MLIHNYVEEVFGSKVKVKILRTMFKFPTKTFTGRELANLTKNVSHMAVSKSIKDLADMNLIEIEHHGTSNLLKLNKDTYLFKTLKEIFMTERKTIDHLKNKIKNYFKNKRFIKTIVIFGSVANKKEEIDSDIDLLIILKKKCKITEIIDKLQKDINKEFGNVIMPYILTEKEFYKKKNKPVIKNITKNNILVFGDKI